MLNMIPAAKGKRSPVYFTIKATARRLWPMLDFATTRTVVHPVVYVPRDRRDIFNLHIFENG